ncbi:MAG: coenzyme F420-0:L-glutamate ligase [Caldisericia bacterium]|nr:coenzyme F420-0:L-glutamate ligase [Caldisericia bacterium]
MSSKLTNALKRQDYKEVVDLLIKKSPASISDKDAGLLSFALRRLGKTQEAKDLLVSTIKDNYKKYPTCVRHLTRILSLEGKFEEAYQLVRKSYEQNSSQHWHIISMGDIFYYFANDLERALSIYLEGTKIDKENLRPDILSIYRYILKRISHILFDLKKYDQAIEYFEEFKRLEPSNFYESDFVLLGKCYEQSGQWGKAIETWLEGTRRRKGNKCFAEIKRIDPETAATVELVKPLPSKPGTIKIPIKTKIITEEDDAGAVIAQAIKGKIKQGDIITFASAVASITQGRIFQAETINPSGLANFLSGFVSASSKNAYATTSPLANPLSFQVAIDMVGACKISWAAFCGAVGKVLKKKGWFYTVAGPEVAMIDDMPASMAPYDYYVIPGPYDSNMLAQSIKNATGFETAIVDANDLGIAWVVGATDGVDKKALEGWMADNPAGNEDDQTPVIIVRRTDA